MNFKKLYYCSLLMTGTIYIVIVEFSVINKQKIIIEERQINCSMK